MLLSDRPSITERVADWLRLNTNLDPKLSSGTSNVLFEDFKTLNTVFRVLRGEKAQHGRNSASEIGARRVATRSRCLWDRPLVQTCTSTTV